MEQGGQRVTADAAAQYEPVLADFLRTHSEGALYHASLLSQEFVEAGLGPEEIIALHFEALDRALAGYSYREQARAVGEAHQFLLEVMIAYGLKYREYLELRLRESMREAEARAELERQRALDAERAQRERTELLAMIAHELRTPISAAMGNIDLARRSLKKGRTDDVPPLLDSSRSALDRLSRLSADLVQASRGTLPELNLAPHDLGDLLAEACAWVAPAAQAKQLRLVREAGPAAAPVVGDGQALLSIFGNLLSNAVRYTPEGGTITVRHDVEEGRVWVEVEDTGIGIEPEARERIFERFYRASEARQVEARGLGLGLALAHDLARAHEGWIEVRSEPNQGSTFRVVLPAATAAGDEGSGA